MKLPNGTVPPNSILYYEVELLRWVLARGAFEEWWWWWRMRGTGGG